VADEVVEPEPLLLVCGDKRIHVHSRRLQARNG
jgi:hypothetical protein